MLVTSRLLVGCFRFVVITSDPKTESSDPFSFHQIGLQSGLRNSGIVLSSVGRPTIAFRSTASLAVPLVIDGELLVESNYLRQLVKLANDKMAANGRLIERLSAALEAFFSN